MSKSKIPWTQYTANPFPGCQKCSTGCLHCYAERTAKRLKAMGQAKYQSVVDENGWTGEVGCDLDCMRVPGKGKMVFCQSMGDLAYQGITQDQFNAAVDAIRDQPWHSFQILTKRPEHLLHKLRACCHRYTAETPNRELRNLWAGVTVCNQPEADEKILILLQIPAAVRFVSFEPLLEDIELTPWIRESVSSIDYFQRVGPDRIGQKERLDWIICGAETGPGARPCELDWIKHIVEQCLAAGVPPFVKAVRDIDGEIITDIDRIASRLNMPPEKLRQYPGRKEA